MAQKIISMDFDSTLTLPQWDKEDRVWFEGTHPNIKNINLIKLLHGQGYKIHIVTSRNSKIYSHTKEVYDFIVKYLKGYISGVHFTGGSLNQGKKFETLKKLKPIRHYDDNSEDIEDAEKAGVQGIKILHPADEGKNLPPGQNKIWDLIKN